MSWGMCFTWQCVLKHKVIENFGTSGPCLPTSVPQSSPTKVASESTCLEARQCLCPSPSSQNKHGHSNEKALHQGWDMTHSTALEANNRTYSKYLKDDKTNKRLYVLSRHTTLMQCLVHCTTRCFVTLYTLYANQQATTCLKDLYPLTFVYLPYYSGSILPRTGCVLTVTSKRVHV